MAKEFPLIELSQSVNMTQNLGIEEFEMGDNYAVVTEKPLNGQRQQWGWVWNNVTQDQFEVLRKHFLVNPTDFTIWTPPGQSTALKFRPPAGELRGAFSAYDNVNFRINVNQVYDNG